MENKPTASVSDLVDQLASSLVITPRLIGQSCVNSKVSRGKRMGLYFVQSGKCHYCRNFTKLDKWTVDHKIPLIRGGTNDVSNLVGCCSSCNHLKDWLTDVEFSTIPHELIVEVTSEIDRREPVFRTINDNVLLDTARRLETAVSKNDMTAVKHLNNYLVSCIQQRQQQRQKYGKEVPSIIGPILKSASEKLAECKQLSTSV